MYRCLHIIISTHADMCNPSVATFYPRESVQQLRPVMTLPPFHAATITTRASTPVHNTPSGQPYRDAAVQLWTPARLGQYTAEFAKSHVQIWRQV